MCDPSVFLLILMTKSIHDRQANLSMRTVPMTCELSVEDQMGQCKRLLRELPETWKGDPLISQLNYSLTCISNQ